ncbi:glycosyltransferase family 2 protein [Paramuribaculum intestinale]|uniref:glycosyltransferase family 2 protein n=1 Tax=Paramuribaculum intestinale TaxID=2094151 RepID=UPI0025B10749|nr:glycosyltransferase family 2 protein [Paramuribaculum intestinale]
MNQIKISVIVPTYCPGEYLKDCIASLNKQDLDPSEYEIIIVLNGPKYPYWDNIKQLIGDDKRYDLLYSAEAGVSNARNKGIDAARGEFLTFMDDDDIVSPQYLSGMMEISDTKSIGVSMVRSFRHDISHWSSNFFICKKMAHIEKYRNASFFKNRSFISYVAGKLLHRNIIGNIRFNDRFTNGEDALFMTTITKNVINICFTNYDSCYYVRERIGSASRRKISKFKLLRDSLGLIHEYISIYCRNPFRYSLPLFLSRIPGVMKNAYVLAKNK